MEKERGEYVCSRFYIVEIVPSKRYSYDNGHGGAEYGWTSRQDIRQPYKFETRKDAQKFLDEHEPDEGNRLEIREEKLYRKTVEKWY